MEENNKEEITIMEYIGPGLGLIGGIMLLLVSILFFSEYSLILEFYPLLIVPEIVTPILAISAIISSLLIIYRKNFGKFILFFVGIVGCITNFIPIQTIPIDGGMLSITISGNFFIIDPFLVAVGGLFGLFFN
ncbi:MAG: hypothetical protein EU543_05995 [Promethearchaeota archaeon]|nr:MAG: hypothetical protein EU543_05995 [Candidatus Lokiarchaeota archaeon]